jgi:hypothetical protein
MCAKFGKISKYLYGTQIENYLSSSYPIKNDLKQEVVLSPILFNFDLEYAISKVQETWVWISMDMNWCIRMIPI